LFEWHVWQNADLPKLWWKLCEFQHAKVYFWGKQIQSCGGGQSWVHNIGTVRCSVLQRAAVSCSLSKLLQWYCRHVAVCYRVWQSDAPSRYQQCQHVAACCSVDFANCCSVLQRVAEGCSVLQSLPGLLPVVIGLAVLIVYLAVCCSVMQCVAVCCSVLQSLLGLVPVRMGLVVLV